MKKTGSIVHLNDDILHESEVEYLYPLDPKVKEQREKAAKKFAEGFMDKLYCYKKSDSNDEEESSSEEDMEEYNDDDVESAPLPLKDGPYPLNSQQFTQFEPLDPKTDVKFTDKDAKMFKMINSNLKVCPKCFLLKQIN